MSDRRFWTYDLSLRLVVEIVDTSAVYSSAGHLYVGARQAFSSAEEARLALIEWLGWEIEAMGRALSRLMEEAR